MNYVAHICCLETLTTSGAKHVLMKLFPLEKFSPYLVKMFYTVFLHLRTTHGIPQKIYKQSV